MNDVIDGGTGPSGLTSRSLLPEGPPPLILIVEDQEWSARALESILAPVGYAVLRAYSGHQGVERAVAGRPDAILVDLGLPDMSGLDVCRALIREPRIGAATPLLVTTADLDSRRRRLEALQCGAWEFVALPPDVDELLAKLNTWIRAKRETERARDEGLLDAATGTYNARGLLQRANELASEAARYQRPLSCVVFTMSNHEMVEGGEPDAALVQRVRDALRATVRTSDALGRLTPDQFAVLAPATDPEGAKRIAQRALDALDIQARSAGDLSPLEVHAGYFGVENFRSAALEASELLARAAIALRTQHQPNPREPRIHGYPERPPFN